jgi:hypothetical protein
MQNGKTWNCEFLNFNVLLIQLNVSKCEIEKWSRRLARARAHRVGNVIAKDQVYPEACKKV